MNEVVSKKKWKEWKPQKMYSWPASFNQHVRQLKEQVIEEHTLYLASKKINDTLELAGVQPNLPNFLSQYKNRTMLEDANHTDLSNFQTSEEDLLIFMLPLLSQSEHAAKLFDTGQYKDHRRLMTEKYRPSVPGELIGNIQKVDQLRSWLGTWTSMFSNISKLNKKREEKRRKLLELERELFDLMDGNQSQCAVQSSEEKIPGVLLVCGPVGCGKTTAIYTCARASGYSIIEVNCAQTRSGKELLSMVGEATRSHKLTASTVEDDQSHISDEYELNEPCLDSLLLIEEVDAVFEEDKGFWTAIQTISQSTRRPIILTCNGNALVVYQTTLTDINSSLQPRNQKHKV
jgi:hypothetical protein